MAFRLQKGEAVDAGFRRSVLEQIDSAIDHLSGPIEERQQAVHETRKSFKRIRALLRLLRPHLGEVFGHENARIRDLSALLSPYRDADAMLETLAKLHQALPELIDQPMYQAAHASLLRSREQVVEDAAGYPHAAARVVEGLEEARNGVGDWPVPHSLEEVQGLLQKTYKRARKAFVQASESGEVEDFHTWRKRVKDLLYQSQLLRDTPLALPKPFHQSLAGFAELLGDHHDLTVFEELLAQPEVFADQQHASEVLEAVTHRRVQLQEDAIRSGGELFGQPAKRFFS